MGCGHVVEARRAEADWDRLQEIVADIERRVAEHVLGEEIPPYDGTQRRGDDIAAITEEDDA